MSLPLRIIHILSIIESYKKNKLSCFAIQTFPSPIDRPIRESHHEEEELRAKCPKLGIQMDALY